MRTVLNLNAGWLFAKATAEAPETLPADWEAVDLPHSWNATDGQDGGNDYFRGTCCYAKTLKKAELPEGMRYWLEICGANSSAKVFVDGKEFPVTSTEPVELRTRRWVCFGIGAVKPSYVEIVLPDCPVQGGAAFAEAVRTRIGETKSRELTDFAPGFGAESNAALGEECDLPGIEISVGGTAFGGIRRVRPGKR